MQAKPRGDNVRARSIAVLRLNMRLFVRALVSGLLLLAGADAFGQTDTRVITEEYSKLVEKGQDIAPLGTTLFGDQTSLHSGVTTFNVVDVSLPGNNSLPVEFRRRFDIEDRFVDGYVGSMGNWDIDVPQLHGTFATSGWQVSGGNPPSDNRCSVPGGADYASPPDFSEFFNPTYWHGNFLHIPGLGDQEMLVQNATTPAGPATGTSPWLTKSLWYFGCTTLDNGSGEGFIGISPSGVKYTFNHQIIRTASGITLPNWAIIQGNPQQHAPVMARETVYLVATKVQDRFGNTVTYSYSGDDLIGISSSDGRSIAIGYYPSTHYVKTVTTGSSTWTYGYENTASPFTWLNLVTLPDNSTWTFTAATTNYLGTRLKLEHNPSEQPPTAYNMVCLTDSIQPADVLTYTIKHPSGAQGAFVFTPTREARQLVEKDCILATQNPGYYRYPPYSDVFALTSRQFTGPGLNTLTWTYGYPGSMVDTNIACAWSTGVGNPACANHAKTISVTDPENVVTTYTFGVGFEIDEGQLREEKVTSGSSTLRDTTYKYVSADDISGAPTTYAFPLLPGDSPQNRSDLFNSAEQHPQKQRTIAQDGATFDESTTQFDLYVNPLSVTKSSSLGYSKTEVSTYDNNTSLWVIGQLHTLTVTDGASTTQVAETDYDSSTALPTAYYAFSKLKQTQTYNTDGTVWKVTDALSHTYTFTNYKRGIPQSVQLPDTNAMAAVVNNWGHLDSYTDALNNTTSYLYDGVGRLTRITYPSSDTVNWTPTTISFAPLTSVTYGLPVGAWKQTVSTGNGITEKYFDALWRSVVTRQYDSANLSGTQHFTIDAYDSQGQDVYKSYPVSSISAYSDRPTGVSTTYDAIGRATEVDAGSELGTLTTFTTYATPFQRTVKNPRGKSTTTSFQAFDSPTEDYPVSITAPETLSVSILRDVYNKPLSITRSGKSQVDNTAVSQTRSYVYDSAQRLCKTIDPEIGATITQYDDADNVSWTATGLPLPDPASCNQNSTLIAAVKSSRIYDPVNRLTDISYADSSSSIHRGYYADGKLQTLTSGTTTWTYGYDKRRLLESESLAVGAQTLLVSSAYDTNGHLKTLVYPDLTSVDYAPDALGQPTQAGAYGSNVQHYPNGAIKSFTYGNGIVHTLTQNARELPSESKDLGVLDDVYTFDADGNVAGITDSFQNLTTRTMTYDDLDRLYTTSAPNLWGSASYLYDALDNLRQSTVGSRTYKHSYDGTNKLNGLYNGSSLVTGYSYDARGNLSNRGSQGFTFDQANRLKSTTGSQAANNESYVYDGNGRRTVVTRNDGSQRTIVYSNSGPLLYEIDTRNSTLTDYIYLGHSLVARVDSTAIPVPIVTAPATNNTGAYTVSWTTVAGANLYLLQENANNAGWVQIYSGAGTSDALTQHANGTYQYRAQACIGSTSNCSAYSAVATTVVSGVAAPAAPATITATPPTSFTGNYTISWSAVAGATSYTLQQGVNGGAMADVYTGTATSVPFTGIVNGTYRYQVRACTSVCSAYTPPITETVTHGTVPAVPTLTVPSSSTTGNYTVSWTSVSGATAYQLDELVNNVWSTVYTGAGTSFTLTSRASGTYGYRIRACNATGCGDYSAVSSISVGITIPLPPSSITAPATSATGIYDVQWTASANATQYTVQERVNGGAWTTVFTGSALIWEATGRANGTYTYQVAACNGPSLCSGYTTMSTSVVVSIVAVPGAPTITAPSGGNTTGTYTVVWTAVTGATSYQLNENANGAGMTQVYSGTATSRSFTHANGNYTYQVRACNAAGCGLYSANKIVNVNIPSIPPIPTGLSGPGTSTTGNFTISWTASSGSTSYQLDQSFNSGAWSQIYNSSATSDALTGRAAGQYQYRVRGCNTAGCSSNTAPITVLVQAPPGAPASISVPATSTTGNYTVSWSSVAGATAYQLDEQKNGGAWTQVYSDASNNTSLTGRTNGTYSYRARACAALCGANSGTASLTVTLGGTVAVPTGLSGPTGNLSSPATYTITWNAVSGATSYQLKEQTSCDNVQQVFTVTTNSWNTPTIRTIQCDGQALPSQIYTYWVQACVGSSCSAWSSAIHVTLVQGSGPHAVVAGGGTKASSVGTTSVVSYLHTDALGSLVATTNASGGIVSQNRYEPFGAPTSSVYVDGPGYAGHVTDAATGLTYMQARYYDPLAASFLSTDPSPVEPVSASNFNRYHYAENNPYKYFDPDGREDEVAVKEASANDFDPENCVNLGCTNQPLVNAVRDVSEGASQIADAGDKAAMAAVDYAKTAMIPELAVIKITAPVLKFAGIGARLSKIGTEAHHAWAKYLGGPKKQDLVRLSVQLHREYHRGLDAIAPRRWKTEYYENLSASDLASKLKEVGEYTKAFDAKYGTNLYDAMIKEGFPVP